MDSNVYLVEDIAAILRGIALAHTDVVKRMPLGARTAYSEGFASAIRSVAMAFHVIPDFGDSLPLTSTGADGEPDDTLEYYVVSLGDRKRLPR